LSENLIRLHVVANSDSDADQCLKLKVRDAVVAHLQPAMTDMQSQADAKAYLNAHLAELERIANQTLLEAGCLDKATVSLQKEAFPVRHYDTFSLPSGVYQSLRITIGEGEGHNWWCVVFPSLCLPAAGETMEDTAAGAGFSDGLSGALEGEQPYQVRFFLLDLLGKVQNFFQSFV
jgi:stage II sporulation protein R